MKLNIEITLDNASFYTDDNELNYQYIQDMLILVAENIGDGNTNENIKDINGNNVGQHYIDGEIVDNEIEDKHIDTTNVEENGTYYE